MKTTLLLVDDEKDFREDFAQNVLREAGGYNVLEAENPDKARKLLAKHLVHAAIVDIRLSDAQDKTDHTGLDLCREIDPTIVRILLTGFPEWPIVREAMMPSINGTRIADGFLEKSSDSMSYQLDEIRRLIRARFEIIPQKRIAMLTSGGDSPGMNAAIRAVVRSAMNSNIEVMAVEDGYRGLAENRMYPLRWNDVSDIPNRGGTMLRSDRYKPFETRKGRAPAVANIQRRHISGLIVIGGDGSMKGATALAKDLSEQKVKLSTVAIPATIDNDIAKTDMSLGADSAVNAMVSELRDMVAPAQALRRIFVVEVMGATCGYLALQSALGVGADAVIVPEKLAVFEPGDAPLKDRFILNDTMDNFRAALAETAALLRGSFELGKRYGFVIVAEAFKKLAEQTSWLKEAVQFLESAVKRWPEEIRPTVREQELGYPVRGVAPTRFDVWLGSRMGDRAVQYIKEGMQEQMVTWTEHESFGHASFDEVVEATARTPVEKWQSRPMWQTDLATLELLTQFKNRG